MEKGKTKLTEYFPMIKTREEILGDIQNNRRLKRRFNGWSNERQEAFLDICTGEKGVKILYDSFFKEIMSPEYAPERISNLLSVLIGKEVKVLEVLPTESRISDEESLLVLDILVKMADGGLADIEVQKVGYKFAGARAACYSADLLLRQYKRIREQSTRADFSYKNIKNVYTIVIFEQSPKEFIHFYNIVNKDVYIHKSEQKSDTGIVVNLLQKYIFVSLDIFKKIYQNKDIDTKSAAWMTFLSTDEPEVIEKLIRAYPEFIPLYEDLYHMCNNVERVMELYSKELAELDRNTVHLMIDEYQEEVEKLKGESEKLKEETEKLKEESKKLKEESEKFKEESEKFKEESELRKEKDARTISQLMKRIEELEATINRQDRH